MTKSPISFKEFELDIEGFELRRSGYPVKLERIPMQLLILLLANPGRLVRRETIEHALWGENHFLEAEHSINTAINKLRATLRDDSRDPKFIRTVVGKGYRFIAEVRSSEYAGRSLATLDLPAAPPPVVITSMTLATKGAGALEAIREPFRPSDSAEEDLPDTVQSPSVTCPERPAISAARRAETSFWFAGRWLMIGLLVALAAVVKFALLLHLFRTGLNHRPQSAEPAAAYRSVAVLPFRNLAQDTDQEYLVDGLTDQLISDLAMSTPLRVISSSSVMQYKGVQLPLREIAKALNVDTVVEGSYLRQGDEIRITAQLLDAHKDRHLWAQVYSESDKNLLAMQDQVTREIAREVALSLGSSFNGPKSRQVNEAARNDYLLGRYLWTERTPAGIRKSIDYYTDAIRADRNYAEAYAALSESYLTLSSYGSPNPADLLWKAQFAAERALALDGNLSAAHTALAGVKNDRDWDWRGAEEEYRRAIAINPSDTTAHHWYGLHLVRMRRGQEGLTELERASALDPLSLIIATDIAESYYYLRKPQDAMKRVDQVIGLNPNFAQAHLVKANLLEQQGQFGEAGQEFDLGTRLFGGGVWSDANRGYLLAAEGKRAEAIKLAHSLGAASTLQYVSAVHVAVIYCALHDGKTAMQWLDRAYDTHDTSLDMLGVDPRFDDCRSDPRFQTLLRRLKLIE